ncbi:MAG: Biopolymer transport protein ExbD/TolR [Fibrobacterota bacterium]|jgi:biopolymer transport protein ExbD
MFRKRHDLNSHLTQEELNLTPFLDVMIVLIPFLMLSASFASVVVVKASLPSPVTNPVPVKMPPPFDLVAQVSPDTIKVWLDPAKLNSKPVAQIPTPGKDAYSSATLDALHKALVAVKAQHPTETRLALDAAPGVSLERMSQLMDISAILLPADVFPGRVADDLRLFPDVALKGVYVP